MKKSLGHTSGSAARRYYKNRGHGEKMSRPSGWLTRSKVEK